MNSKVVAVEFEEELYKDLDQLSAKHYREFIDTI